MGAHMSTTYTDQIIGNVSYPEIIQNDLISRDSIEQQKPNQKNIHSVYQFTQNYANSFLFAIMLKYKNVDKQHLIWNSGENVVKMSLQSIRHKSHKNQNLEKILVQKNIISAMDINDCLCAVGTVDGKLIVWDLNFNTIKIEISLPKPSTGVSSINLIYPYIFTTDTSPTPICYCFCLFTSKLLSHCPLSTPFPILNSCHLPTLQITCHSTGLCFQHYSSTTTKLTSIKGMFQQYPKTAQTSLKTIGQMIISAGVDGYVYLWTTKAHCVGVVKCFQDVPILAITYNHYWQGIVVSAQNCKTRTFKFKVKTSGTNTQEQKYEIEYSLAQAYDDQFPTQCITNSPQSPLHYYKTSRGGTMTSYLLPSTQPHNKKLKQLQNLQLIRMHIDSNKPPQTSQQTKKQFLNQMEF